MTETKPVQAASGQLPQAETKEDNSQAIVFDPNARESKPPFHELPIIVFGEPGMGKTTFLSQCPGTCILFTDAHQQGSLGGRCASKDILSWKAFKQFVSSQESDGYSSFCIDIIDALWSMCQWEVSMERFGTEYPEGSQWGVCNKEFMHYIKMLNAKAPVRHISHVREKDGFINAGNGIQTKIKVLHPHFSTGQVAKNLAQSIYMQGYVSIIDGQHMIDFRHCDYISTKERTNVLKRCKAPLPLEWGVVENAYNKMCEHFGYDIVSMRN